MNLKDQQDYVNDALGIDAESEWALMGLSNKLTQEIERDNRREHTRKSTREMIADQEA